MAPFAAHLSRFRPHGSETIFPGLDRQFSAPVLLRSDFRTHTDGCRQQPPSFIGTDDMFREEEIQPPGAHFGRSADLRCS